MTDVSTLSTFVSDRSAPAKRSGRAETFPHEPLAPWKRVPLGDSQNAWTSALEFALVTAGAGDSDNETNSLAAITQHLFSGHGLKYASAYRGIPGYMGGKEFGTFALSKYMEKTGPVMFPRIKRSSNIINCYDQAAAVHVLGSLVGVCQSYVYMEPFGYLNEINLIGVGPCNNPFFPDASPALARRPIDEMSIREGFGNHAFVSCKGCVFDACAGPELGERTHAAYISAVIDCSTPQEAIYAGSSVSTGAVTKVY